MSRQSKNARNRKIAEGFSLQRKAGGRGPITTIPKHGKADARRAYTATKRTAPAKRDPR